MVDLKEVQCLINRFQGMIDMDQTEVTEEGMRTLLDHLADELYAG